MLDVDRLADAVLIGTKALIDRELVPLLAANADLRTKNEVLEARLSVVEARDFDGSIRATMDAIETTRKALDGLRSEPEVPDVAGMVQEAVSAAVAGLEPPPAPDVAPMVAEAVKVAVDALPPPQPGKDAELPDIAGMVRDAVGQAVAAIELPQAPDVAALVDGAVAAIPRPADGKDYDPAELEALRSEIADVRKAIPGPVEMPDLSGYAMKADIETLKANQTASDEQFGDHVGAQLATISEEIGAVRKEILALPAPPDLSGYVMKADLEAVAERVAERLPVQKDYGPDIAEAVETLRREIPAMLDAPDLSGYATKAALAEAISHVPEPKDYGPEIDAVRKQVDALVIPDAPDLSWLATKDALAAVEAKIVPVPEIKDYSSDIAEAMEALRREIPEPPVPIDLSGLAEKSEVDVLSKALARIGPDIDAVVEALRKEIPAIPDAPDLSGFATKEDLASVEAKIVPAPEVKDFGPEIEALRREIPKVPEVIPGRDGVGIAEVKQNADGELIVKLTTGDTFNVGKVRGEDGFGFEDMSVDWDGERRLTLSFVKGGRTEVTELTIPAIIDRGVWKDGTSYERGDAVTWGGSVSIAQRDTTDKPGESDAWRLAVRAGRDFRPPLEERKAAGPIKVGTPKK